MIISSIDIYKNKVVRLYKGKIDNCTFYGYYNEYIDFYYSIKIKKIHIVLLDNIFFKKKNKIKINKIIKSQIGGGIYSCEIIKFYLKQNFVKFVLGSILFKNKKEFKKILSFYNKKILISLDCLNNFVIINGWIKNTNISFEKIFLYLFDLNIKNIIFTNIAKDGTLSGIKIEEIFFLINKKNLCNFIISGGISNINNIIKIYNLYNFNFIIGLSLYKFTIKIKNL
ncbi:HisA/HisF-related TIM barrel protein [Candidatus Carsonella ruddii]|uniref:Phosphoribosylformimino-5-aminoimidazole carboxamide ribotide isomerase n=1 Tax=Carsonella ruddii TaxID=114186 RepID=A0A1U9RSD9_CARRU|nr:HisA/HisF-related TIM barrel protein [Candidatus Carsonella ruddii]AQU89491.1 Phosphoribosylformimino-5-aminoimidazole carboxamide ribotide isomerase [Candidatus Carsonella ruddii]